MDQWDNVISENVKNLLFELKNGGIESPLKEATLYLCNVAETIVHS